VSAIDLAARQIDARSQLAHHLIDTRACVCRGFQSDTFVPLTVSPSGASSPLHCFSEYAQINDGAWHLPIPNDAGASTANNVTTFAACVDMCTASSCQMVTYDYREQACTIRMPVTPVPGQEVLLALKAVLNLSPNNGPWSEQGHDTSADTMDLKVLGKAIGSGKYTFYQVRKSPQGNRLGGRRTSQCSGFDIPICGTCSHNLMAIVWLAGTNASWCASDARIL
jgi:hypothetical protein